MLPSWTDYPALLIALGLIGYGIYVWVLDWRGVGVPRSKVRSAHLIWIGFAGMLVSTLVVGIALYLQRTEQSPAPGFSAAITAVNFLSGRQPGPTDIVVAVEVRSAFEKATPEDWRLMIEPPGRDATILKAVPLLRPMAWGDIQLAPTESFVAATDVVFDKGIRRGRIVFSTTAAPYSVIASLDTKLQLSVSLNGERVTYTAIRVGDLGEARTSESSRTSLAAPRAAPPSEVPALVKALRLDTNVASGNQPIISMAGDSTVDGRIRILARYTWSEGDKVHGPTTYELADIKDAFRDQKLSAVVIRGHPFTDNKGGQGWDIRWSAADQGSFAPYTHHVTLVIKHEGREQTYWFAIPVTHINETREGWKPALVTQDDVPPLGR